MTCEFLKDENDSIWFSYAKNIQSRPVKGRNEFYQRTKKVNYINKAYQASLLEQLENHRVKSREKGNENIQQLYGIMSRHYDAIKENLGLQEALESSSEDE